MALSEKIKILCKELQLPMIKVFSQWNTVLANDKVVTTAILERLLHHSHVINILGDSYRLKEKKEEGMVDSDLYKFKAQKPVKGVK